MGKYTLIIFVAEKVKSCVFDPIKVYASDFAMHNDNHSVLVTMLTEPDKYQDALLTTQRLCGVLADEMGVIVHLHTFNPDQQHTSWTYVDDRLEDWMPVKRYAELSENDTTKGYDVNGVLSHRDSQANETDKIDLPEKVLCPRNKAYLYTAKQVG